jgi:hypothetical protein
MIVHNDERAAGEESLVPPQNVLAYGKLYRIEVAIRELIVELLDGVDDPRWYRKRLPEQVWKASLDKLRHERSSRWIQMIPLHPIYYTNFSDLQQIIGRQDNWRDVFHAVFGRKEIVSGTLMELDPIRNRIAHNRRATRSDLAILSAAEDKLKAAFGQDRYYSLVDRCTSAPGIAAHLASLVVELNILGECCIRCKTLPERSVWKTLSGQWWLDDEYLGSDLTSLRVFYDLLTAYAELPRVRGYGHEIEAWVAHNDLDGKLCAARASIEAIVQGE